MRESAFTAVNAPPFDYRVSSADKSNMAQYLFGGFNKCLSNVAVQWCGWASEHARTYGGKPWRYALIPHDAISENMTIEFMLKQYG